MDNMEKVEKIRELANVSFEEAKAALEENNWDLLDAMVSLEKQGKTKTPEQTSYSTSYEQQENYVSVQKTIQKEKKKKEKRHNLGDIVRKFIRICRDNSFCVTRKGDEIIKVPLFLVVIALFFFWKPIAIVMIVALFFNFRYSFEGKDELKEANRFMESAGNMAENVKGEFVKKDSEKDADEFEKVENEIVVVEPESSAASVNDVE